jgi:16S rRNA (cytosine967-C5)-methyltransferase
LAIAGWAGDAAFLRAALAPHELKWLELINAVDVATLAPKLRHNLPDWIAQPLQTQLGEEAFWALVASLDASAPLDLRVNALNTKREAAQAALAAAGIEAVPTPYSPWGLRVQGRPCRSCRYSRAAKSRCKTKAASCWP